jgi:hypothetical protein
MEQKDLSLKTIYVAIPSLYDEELERTIDDAIAKAEFPERVFLGVAIQDNGSKLFNKINKKFGKLRNVRLSFTKFKRSEYLDDLGVGLGRAKSHELYKGEDYVLQIDSHTMFEEKWDSTLIGLHEEALSSTQNKKTVITAYAGHYFLDASGKRTSEFPANLPENKGFYYSLYSQFQRKYGVIPAASMVASSTITDIDVKFFPASKFSANFAFGDREFAKNLGLETKSIFFEEEVIQSVNLLSSGFSLAFPNVDTAVIRHLYSIQGSKVGSRKASSDYISRQIEKELNLKQQNVYLDFLSNPENKDARESYERYANISLEFGRQSASTMHPSGWVLDIVDYESVKEEFHATPDTTSESEDASCGCKTKHDVSENHDGHKHEEITVSHQTNESEPGKPKVARPWDLLNPNIGRVSDEVKKLRMEFCTGCEFFVSLTQQCTKCGCIMPAKTGLPHASCPVGKWDAVPDEGN